MPTIEQERLSLKRSRLVRAVYLIFFLFAFGVGETVLGLLAVVQFVWLLATGEPNRNLSRLGASLAQPQRPVLVLVGDGGLQFTLPELGVLRDLGAWVGVIVWNNDGYGEIKSSMIEAGVAPTAVDLKPP